MTNKKAIDAIKSNYPDSRYSILREALDMSIGLLEKQEKYCWHDLRQNPDDYPKDNGMYLLELDTDEPIVRHVIWRGDMIRPNTEDDVHILAWKCIEPFTKTNKEETNDGLEC